MAVHDCDAIALRGDGDVEEVVEACGSGVDAAEDLGCFPLNLFFLATDVRDHVVEDVHARDARVAAAGDGLERGDGDGAEAAKGILQGFERHNEARGGAVGIGDEEAPREALVRALMWDYGEVGCVDEGHHQRGGWVAAVVFGIGEDDEVSLDEFGL